MVPAIGFSSIDASYNNSTVQNALLNYRMHLFTSGLLKGMNVESPYNGTIYSNQDFIDLTTTGCNVVRVPIHLTKNVSGTFYDWPETLVQYIETVLVKGDQLGFRVIVVMQTMPTVNDWWSSVPLQNSIISTWVALANRFKGYSALQAYDIMNEPNDTVYTAAVKTAWATFAQAIATPLRAADPNTPIMVEPAWYALADSFWQHPNISVTGLVWSMHFYVPRDLIFQGINGYSYPRSYNRIVDMQTMYDNMLETRNFAALYNVPIFVGEFSCVRYAPNGDANLVITDMINFFEAQTWGYTYLAWRPSWEGWDPEIPYTYAQGAATAANRSTTSSVISTLRTKMKLAPRVI
jgi:hypothetical protein